MKVLEQFFKANMNQQEIVKDGFNVSAAAQRFGIAETADKQSFVIGYPGIMNPREPLNIEKPWIYDLRANLDKTNRGTQFVNALRIADFLSLENYEEAVKIMQTLDVRGKVMLCSIIANANRQLFPDSKLVNDIVKANIMDNIDPEHVSYPDKSLVTDGQIADLYISPYLAKLNAINSAVEEHKEAAPTATALEKVNVDVLAQLLLADDSINGYEDVLRDLRQNHPDDFSSLSSLVSSSTTTELSNINAVLLGLNNCLDE